MVKCDHYWIGNEGNLMICQHCGQIEDRVLNQLHEDNSTHYADTYWLFRPVVG